MARSAIHLLCASQACWVPRWAGCLGFFRCFLFVPLCFFLLFFGLMQSPFQAEKKKKKKCRGCSWANLGWAKAYPSPSHLRVDRVEQKNSKPKPMHLVNRVRPSRAFQLFFDIFKLLWANPCSIKGKTYLGWTGPGFRLSTTQHKPKSFISRALF